MKNYIRMSTVMTLGFILGSTLVIGCGPDKSGRRARIRKHQHAIPTAAKNTPTQNPASPSPPPPGQAGSTPPSATGSDPSAAGTSDPGTTQLAPAPQAPSAGESVNNADTNIEEVLKSLTGDKLASTLKELFQSNQDEYVLVRAYHVFILSGQGAYKALSETQLTCSDNTTCTSIEARVRKFISTGNNHQQTTPLVGEGIFPFILKIESDKVSFDKEVEIKLTIESGSQAVVTAYSFSSTNPNEDKNPIAPFTHQPIANSVQGIEIGGFGTVYKIIGGSLENTTLALRYFEDSGEIRIAVDYPLKENVSRSSTLIYKKKE
ncbi:MAG: hypothetical protein KDD35_00605 [Bdellovibrionales bacterium]|nr:hypothetical protein [Bdellovibrionales bacterium]